MKKNVLCRPVGVSLVVLAAALALGGCGEKKPVAPALPRVAEAGQIVGPGLNDPVLFVLAEDLARMELLANVDEADIGQVALRLNCGGLAPMGAAKCSGTVFWHANEDRLGV